MRDHAQLRGPLQALPHLAQHVEEDGGEEDAATKAEDHTWQQWLTCNYTQLEDGESYSKYVILIGRDRD